MPVTSASPPASDIINAFCPPGPTSSTSMSSGNVWPKPVRVTVTFVTFPVNPATEMFDGYGEPAELSLIVIGAEFEKVFTGGGVPVAVAVAVFVAVFVFVGLGLAVAVPVAVDVDVPVNVGVGVGVGPLIEKFASEMSKKTLPMDSTFILPAVVPVLGMVNDSEPSFAVLAARTTGKLRPPSNEMEILTLATLTVPVLVLATSQVTVCDDPPGKEPPIGPVTLNGPAVFVTVTTVFENCVWPMLTPGTYGTLSRTVSLKFKVLETELNASMLAPASPPGNGGVTNNPARIVDNLGKDLVGDIVDGKVSQLGPVNLPGDATLPAPVVVELSLCSQL